MIALRFYLVRHGAAEPPGAEGDAARRLTAEGRARFAAHARSLAAEMKVTRVATSPLLRARETADLLALTSGAAVDEDPALRPGRSSGRRLLDLGRSLGAGAAVVGHNPEIAEALAHVARKQVEVAPGTVAAVEADAAGFRLAWVRAPA